MKVVNTKNIVCVIIILFCVFPLTLAISDDGFEMGTQFEGSFLRKSPKETLFSLSLPASVPSLGTSLPTLYATWYPQKNIGLTAKGGLGYSSGFGTVGSGGLGISYLPFGYEASTICFSANAVYYGLYDTKNLHLVGAGLSVGWNLGDYSNFVRRVEIQYDFLRGINEEKTEYKISFLISTGVLFSGN